MTKKNFLNKKCSSIFCLKNAKRKLSILDMTFVNTLSFKLKLSIYKIIISSGLKTHKKFFKDF